jgi:hypothetical protein
MNNSNIYQIIIAIIFILYIVASYFVVSTYLEKKSEYEQNEYFLYLKENSVKEEIVYLGNNTQKLIFRLKNGQNVTMLQSVTK